MKTKQTSCVNRKRNIKTKKIVESICVNYSLISYMRKPISDSEGKRFNTMIKQKTATQINSSERHMRIKYWLSLDIGPDEDVILEKLTGGTIFQFKSKTLRLRSELTSLNPCRMKKDTIIQHKKAETANPRRKQTLEYAPRTDSVRKIYIGVGRHLQRKHSTSLKIRPEQHRGKPRMSYWRN